MYVTQDEKRSFARSMDSHPELLGDMSKRYISPSDGFSFFFYPHYMLRARASFAPLLSAPRALFRRIDRASSARQRRSERDAPSIGRHTAKKYKFHLSSCLSLASMCDSGIQTQFASRDYDYYVRMRNLRSCCRIVRILLVARNRFMIRWIKTEMKTSNTITGEG